MLTIITKIRIFYRFACMVLAPLGLMWLRSGELQIRIGKEKDL